LNVLMYRLTLSGEGDYERTI